MENIIIIFYVANRAIVSRIKCNFVSVDVEVKDVYTIRLQSQLCDDSLLVDRYGVVKISFSIGIMLHPSIHGAESGVIVQTLKVHFLQLSSTGCDGGTDEADSGFRRKVI
ncbi:unnamed protein product [Orchesella dallaii]|uniref:Uncharacterized protein n=1 Tax=Orchesella dallaii TaxID=48710 RepID=A0ABP1PN98_9HEXA